MDLRASKKQQFDAFQGNSLVKTTSKHHNNTTPSNMSVNNFDKTYNFDELWRGSVNHLMSSENITEDLIKDSIKELENAMQESKRMLHERDNEIQKLRETIDKINKEKEKEEDEKYPSILSDYKELQTRVMELECEIREVNITHSKELEEVRTSCACSDRYNDPLPGCTCACGASCQALNDLNETKKHLESAKAKYDNLKRKVREFRKQIELEQKEEEEKYNSHEGNKGASCTIQ